MTKTMSDLTEDLVGEILSRVPLTSLGSTRSTCKQWNALSRHQIFGEVAKAKNQILGFMIKDFKFCSVRINIQEINNNVDDFIDMSIKHVSFLNRITIYKVYHCDGLLLCRAPDMLLIWNPYLGQTKWIRCRHILNSFDSFALGYDNNRNHKILHLLDFDPYVKLGPYSGCKVYDISSDSWKVLDITPKWKIPSQTHSVSLEGNAYFYAEEKIIIEGEVTEIKEFLVCFDFTSERFGPRLSLPFHASSSDGGFVTLSRVNNTKLAVLYQDLKTPTIVEIWVTSKIDYSEVLWTKWMDLDMNLLTDFPRYCFRGSFFIDEENKVLAIFNIGTNQNGFNQTAHIIGQDGYFKYRDLGGSPTQVKPEFIKFCPSLVQIE